MVKGVPLPLEFRYLERIAARFVGLPGETSGELKFAMSRDHAPRQYFGEGVYVRVVIDLLNVRGDTAVVIDWKTGKKKPGFEQLMLAAAVLSTHLPEINVFKLGYVWLKTQEITKATLKRTAIPAFWNAVLPKVNQIESAISSMTFPPTPSGLCRYCPVIQCLHNTKPK